jgi:hypothetical protein
MDGRKDAHAHPPGCPDDNCSDDIFGHHPLHHAKFKMKNVKLILQLAIFTWHSAFFSLNP